MQQAKAGRSFGHSRATGGVAISAAPDAERRGNLGLRPQRGRDAHATWRSMGAAAAAVLALTTHSAFAQVPAFPGAEGFGASASGGRGGEVAFVTNLEDSGPGSLRDAVSKDNRTVIFRVSGTIKLKSKLEVKAHNLTIAGETAPGDGICLREHELFIKDTDNVIVRFLRVRPGDEAKVEHDAITIWNSSNVIVDHCSMSWSTDSLNDVVKESGNITLQWCLLSEPLNNSVHVKGAHGYATGWDGRRKDQAGAGGSFHHNLIAHAKSRAPRIGYFKTGRGLIDCRNNVIYNSGSSYGGEGDDLNYVGNYYRPGPSTAELRPTPNVFECWSDDTRMYVAGNVVEGAQPIAADNRAAVIFKESKNANGPTKKGDPAICLIAEPVKVPPVATDSAERAYERVLAAAGARLPALDAVDRRILSDVEHKTGGPINSQADVGGWPELKSAPPPVDTDGDGIPDSWERSHELNPTDGGDGRKLSPSGYSNLELYLHDLVRLTTQPAGGQ